MSVENKLEIEYLITLDI